MKVIGVYDNGGESMDRFTIVLDQARPVGFNILNECIGMSLNPNSSQGFCQFSECQIGEHLGKKITVDTLPQLVQDKLNSLMEET